MLTKSSHSSRKDGPRSPWRRLLVRSRSLEGVASSDENEDGNKGQRRRSKKKKNDSRSSSKGSDSSWGWLLTPPTRLVGNPLRRSSSPKSKRPLFSSARPSNLTMFLLRLDENLPRYCKLLSDPSLAHCQEAASILDSSVATASPTHSPGSSTSSTPSPNFFRQHSPKRSGHAMALEGEWETYVSPLLLLTGAEALYGQMELHNLNNLYKTIQKDLTIVKERLCDPWLAGGAAASQQQQQTATVNPSRSTAYQAATRMALAFDSLQLFLKIKCQLVNMQTQLFAESQEPFAVKATFLLDTCRELLPPRDGNYGDAVTPMFISLIKEIKAWIALLETACHLEQCQFTDTILSARKLKQQVNASSNAVLQLWFQHMLDRIISIMPVYFDRINAFAPPLYGFDTMHLWADSRVSSDHYDSLVLDFLRKHESKGGPSMAVCIVIDAVSTCNLNFGRGFVVKRSIEQSHTKELTPVELERKEWQSVYMRSTVHYNTAASPMTRSPSHGGGSISTIMRRSRGSSFRKKTSIMPASEDDFSRSLASIVRTVSQDSVTPMQAHQSQMNVMEYAPETGPASWPYTEWTLLVELVKDEFPSSSQDDGFSSVQAVTFRQPEPNEATKKAPSLALGQPPLVPSPPPPKPATDSSFHLVRLSDYITMVAIVKCEDDGKWHLRRTRGHSDEEIRVFLNEMALKLKVSILFDKDSVETVKKATRNVDSQQPPEHDLVHVWQHWDEANTHGFLRELKRSFQLRPQSPYMESLTQRGLTTPNRVSRKKKRGVSYSESAAAFFWAPTYN